MPGGARDSSLRKARAQKALPSAGVGRKRVGSRKRLKAPSPYLRRHYWC